MVLLALVVALRRRVPEKMLILALLLGLVQLIADVGTLPANFAFLVIIYTVAADGARWASRIGLTAGLCAAPVAQMRWPADQGVGSSIAIVTFQTVPFALAWVLREPNVASANIGASRPEQVHENVAASGATVDPPLFARAEALIEAALAA